ncbi:DUF294 nucleotidyltransferase-like domain-containing protein [Cytobacillus sp. S13-E01]|uniref:DUF294 nucleotidyltransferase-like domain-containing protein n=1 Tax=Cytobacillus sp. S13-E01 TaxID=3031326 RepID=UPI0023D8A87D|nr:DUF294 nucleotidyltransferase-like domain-containing protein [Cytobacillus sp. S13-E01]MDF0725612.1 DUF294 nucleotidyltransferase-like domain-containing protein [Cytobacillus sp. S13-E01]
MNHTELYTLFENHYPFNLLTEDELETIVTNARQKTFSKNEYLFHENEKVEDLDIFFLVSGLAKNILHRPSGEQVSLRFYYPGDLMGLMIMVTSGEMTFSVQVIEDSTVFRFNKKDFFDIMTKNKDFSRVMFESIGERMKTLYDEIKYKSSQHDTTANSLFRTRIKTIMEKPYFIEPNELMTTAAEKMLTLGVNGLIISNDNNTFEGVINQVDILRFITQGSPFLNKVIDWANRSPYWLNEETFAYEAVAYLKFHQINFIPIISTNQVVKGTLSKDSFIGMENSNFIELTHKVISSESYDELVDLSPEGNQQFHGLIESLLEQDHFAYDVSETITNHNDHLYRQIIKLTEIEMKNEGYGLPPINYCFIVMGSQGRKEQAFSTDQDNGIILNDYNHLSNQNKINSYFDIFTTKINKRLATCGFEECKGGIMARELKWRKSFSEWQNEIMFWLKEMDAEEIQNFTMFYDFRPIYGDFMLAEEIRTLITKKVKRSLNLQQLLIKDTLRFRVPVNSLGKMNILTKQKTLDVKKSGLMQIINCVRIYSIKYGIREVNTIKRLNELKKLQAFHPRDIENAKIALHHLISMRLKQNLFELREGRPTTNILTLNEVSKEDKNKLKEALQVANRMQQALKISLNRNRVI